MPYIGDGVTLHCYFNDKDGNPLGVSNAYIKFYDTKKSQLGETISLDDKKVSEGHYEINYVIPDITSNVVVEYGGINSTNGQPTLHRQEIEVIWIKNKKSGFSF